MQNEDITEEKTFDSMVIFWTDNDGMGKPGTRLLMMDIASLGKLGKITIEWNGHFLSDSDRSMYSYFTEGCGLGRFLDSLYPENNTPDIPSGKCVELIQAAINGKTVEPIEINCMDLTRCGECGEILKLSFDGQTLKILNECTKPNGAMPFSFNIEVPSGKLHIANDLRSACPNAEYEYGKAPNNESRDINTQIGTVNTTLDYAVDNMAHVFVGNSCPGVYRKESGGYVVCNPGYDDEKDEDIPFEEKMESVASIGTDLWWFSMIDEDELRKRFIEHIHPKWIASPELKMDKSECTFENWIEYQGCEVVDVEPGTYQFDVLKYDRDDGLPTIYSTFHRVE